MGFVEPVAGKEVDEVKDILCGLPGHPALDRPVDEGGPLLGQDVRFLLGDALAQDVRFLQREAGHLVGDLHDLFLVDNDAVGRPQDGLDAGVIVVNPLPAVLAVDVLLDATRLDGARAVQGDDGCQVFYGGRLDACGHAFHAAGFHLEHAYGVAGADELVDFGVACVDMADVNRDSRLFPDHVHRVLDNPQVRKAQEIHLQQAEGLDEVLVPLRDDVAVLVTLQRKIVGKLPVGNDDARRVGAEVAVDPLQLHGRVKQFPDCNAAQLRAVIVHGLQLFHSRQRVCKASAEGNEFGDRVGVLGTHAQRPADVAHRLLRFHPAEGGHLCDRGFPVPLTHVLDDLAPSCILEVHVDIRHGDARRIEEALKQKVVGQRVHLGDAGCIRNNGTRGRAAPRSHRYTLAPRKPGEVLHDQEVVHETALFDRLELHARPGGGHALLLRRVQLLNAVHRQLLEEKPVHLGVPRRRLPNFHVARQMIAARRHLDSTHVSDKLRVLDGLLVPGQPFPHLVLCHDVVIRPIEAHAVLVGHLLQRLHAQQDLVGVVVFLPQIVAVAGRHSLRTNRMRNAAQNGKGAQLLLDAVVLQFDEVVLLSEDLLIPPRNRKRLRLVPPRGSLRHLALQAG